MKSNKLNIKVTLIALLLGITTFYGCKEDEDVFEKTRLFRPVLNDELYSEGNSIIANMGNMKEAISYTLEVSRDSFQTVLMTIESDTSYVKIPDLLWNTLYQVKAVAHADDPDYDSKVSDLGFVRTQRFPSIMGIPGLYDVTDVAARVYWTTGGAAVTGLKVFARSDEQLEMPLFELDFNEEDQKEEEKIVQGLDPMTEYQIAIYSDGELRGFENYTTKASLPLGDGVVDLRGIEKSSVLADTLPDIASGSIILLESGQTYETGGYQFDKSVSIRSGYGFNPSGAIIDCGSNFNLKDASTIDSLVFRGVSFTGDITGNYVFNIDKKSSLGELKFEGCKIRKLRGVMRMKGGGGDINTYSFNNCVIDSIGGYGIITIDADAWTVKNISITNSTISKAELFIRNSKGVTDFSSIVIDGCTVNEVPKVGKAIFQFDEGVNVTNGIKIYNTIWGAGWNSDAVEVPSVGGAQGFDGTNFDVKNVYATSDFSFSSDEIPGFPSYVYTGEADILWMAPFTDLNFNFKDSGFAGKDDTGDPRWRVTL